MSEFANAVELDERRRRAGLTQKDLCERAGINISTFTRLMQRQSWNSRTFEKLAAALEEFEREHREDAA